VHLALHHLYPRVHEQLEGGIPHVSAVWHDDNECVTSSNVVALDRHVVRLEPRHAAPGNLGSGIIFPQIRRQRAKTAVIGDRVHTDARGR